MSVFFVVNDHKTDHFQQSIFFSFFFFFFCKFESQNRKTSTLSRTLFTMEWFEASGCVKKKKCKDRVAYASLFGVGAPEALVIGVVALLVFGPKGLAEVPKELENKDVSLHSIKNSGRALEQFKETDYLECDNICVARSLGKTLRAFQPTIRELQEVSREFKSTLEKEIGLDEISSSTPEVDKTTNPPPSLKSIFSNQMAADPSE
ncbi:hypothetical protein L484_004324 [Morus notabilis]|uniref:Sec-independent protein translocase protein TATB n=1 Tax=Morus notabilis TaxID=981085 RepID=W9RIP7_9ROSA|nr:hypothetical protein L484_004324 [Morus notabilis]